MPSMVRSGLTLADANHAQITTTEDDGLLTALGVDEMHLYDTDLEVLSAYQTARGEGTDGEGGYGLRCASVLAGASSLIGTMAARSSCYPTLMPHEAGVAAAVAPCTLQPLCNTRRCLLATVCGGR